MERRILSFLAEFWWCHGKPSHELRPTFFSFFTSTRRHYHHCLQTIGVRPSLFDLVFTTFPYTAHFDCVNVNVRRSGKMNVDFPSTITTTSCPSNLVGNILKKKGEREAREIERLLQNIPSTVFKFFSSKLEQLFTAATSFTWFSGGTGVTTRWLIM